MADHSILPPSSAAVWGSPHGCTGSVLMSQMYPETDETPEAAEGTASHEIGALIILAFAVGMFDPELPKVANNGVVLDDDMIDCAKIYADDVGVIMRKTANFNPQVEQRINCPTIHPQSWGTPDCWFFDRATGHLYGWDYKYGYGVVEAFENWQMINYFAGIIPTLDVPDEHITVHFRIVQPRAYHRDGIVREWVINAAQLRPYFNQLENRAHTALGNSPTFHSGTHCNHCTGRHNCPAAIQAGVQLYEVATQPLPLNMSLEAQSVQLSIVRRAIKQLEYIDSGLSGQIESTIKAGTLVPGWVMEPGRSALKWTAPASEVIALGDMLGIDTRKPVDVKTPTQVVKLGVDESVIMQYSQRVGGKVKLTPDDGTKARRLFQ